MIKFSKKKNFCFFKNRLSDFETTCEQLKNTCTNQERKIDELQRQCSNEKLLRSTLAKLQSELETKCADTQKLTIDYEKQLKNIREELSNVKHFYSYRLFFNFILFSIEENIEIMRINIHKLLIKHLNYFV